MPEALSGAIKGSGSGVTIKIYVTPRSSVNKVGGTYDGRVKVLLTAPPVEGAANKALVEFLSKLLDVPRGAVNILSGETSRQKTVQVTGIEAQAALRRLGLE